MKKFINSQEQFLDCFRLVNKNDLMTILLREILIKRAYNCSFTELIEVLHFKLKDYAKEKRTNKKNYEKKL